MRTRRDFLQATAALAVASPRSVLAEAAKPATVPGVPVNDIFAQLSPAQVFRIEQPASLDELRAALATARKEGRPVCIAGGRQSMGGQPFANDAVMLDMRRLNRVLSLDTERGLLTAEAGAQWPDVLGFLQSAQRGDRSAWTFGQKPVGVDRVTLGGCLAANIHGRGLGIAPIVQDIDSFQLVTARGNVLQCSRSEHPELFSVAIGGFGLFGAIYAVTLRLVPRRKVQPVSEVRDVGGIMGAFDERIRSGFLQGDFRFAIDPLSRDYLKTGVLSCARPLDDATPLPALQREFTADDRVELAYLAHATKGEAFRRVAARALAAGGQVRWSDEIQMGGFPDDYHQGLDRRLNAPVRGTDAMAEITCSRDSLEPFMNAVREHTRLFGVNLVDASVRLVEQDAETFLAWARKPCACVRFTLHIDHDSRGVIRSADALRRLIDFGLRNGGGYLPAYDRHALPQQVMAAFPQFLDFLKLKRKYDRAELFQSEWYRYYRRVLTER